MEERTLASSTGASDGGVLAPSLRSGIDAFAVMDVMRQANERQAAGEDIIHMEVGQPGTPAPRLVLEAVKRELDRGPLGYTDALGLPILRERIAKHYRDSYNIGISPERIVVTTGSSAGFVLAFLALLNPGDGIALPQPGYPCYRQIARVLGLKPVYLPARAESRFMPAAEDLRAAFRDAGARAVLLASPANPTGAMLPAAELAALVRVPQESGGWFISDEIYHGLTYAAPAATALAFSDEAIVINSFSKYFSMTGWRIGWMVVPGRLIRVFERLAQNLYISPPAVSQIGALAAFDATEELETYKQVYAQNRTMLLEELPRAGFGKLAPADGAFYLYADIAHLTGDSEGFVRRMLKEIGVAATPGIDFDEEQGRHFLRFSYAGSFEHMREAVRRLKAWKLA
ncbi:MAG: aminotransferase class I/II-fold pyridoxal phosphate-dependent enzyme [Rhodomicrobium sp.]|nr:aminotransferase class I/II-fold pyridoxal phosphate-dependent enzyme [Rhodomicrobium sp.]